MQVYSSFTPQKNKNYYKKRPFFKNKLLIFFIILILGVIGFVWWAIKSPTPQTDDINLNDIPEKEENLEAEITYLKGTLELINGTQKSNLKKGDKLIANSLIQAGADSRAIITFPDGSLIRLNSSAEVKLKSFGLADIIIEQINGSVFHRVNSQSTAIYRVQNNTTELTALGTAFNITTDGDKISMVVTENRVKVKIYENSDMNNILSMKTIEQAHKAVIDPNKEVADMISSEEQAVDSLLEDDWYVWNKAEDEALGFFLGMFEKTIELEIIEPTQTEFEAESDKLTIKGKTIPEAEIFVDGNEVENQDGNFQTEIKLSDGQNKIEIVVQKGQNKNKKILYVNLKGEVNEDLKLSGSADGTTVNLNWNYNDTDNPSYRVLQAKGQKPTYPDDNYHIISAGASSDQWLDLSAGKYHFRVCLYENQGCQSYSNELVIEITNDQEQDEDISGANLSLSADANDADVSLQWTIDGIEDFDGFKLVINQAPNPSYPANSYHSLISSARSDLWKGLSPGNYHFRICATKGNDCLIYSNNTSVKITSTEPQNLFPTISLSGSALNGVAALSWSTTNLSGNETFKALLSPTPGVTLPAADSKTTSGSTATFADLETGQTYYFRVCRDIGLTCEPYSNEISLTIQ